MQTDPPPGAPCLRCDVHESTEWTCVCDRGCGHPLCVGGDEVSRLPLDELMRRAEALRDAGLSKDNESAVCGCPLRSDGTEPYLHRDGCVRAGDLQVERWLREEGPHAA